MIREELFAHRQGICCRYDEIEYTWGELHEKSTQIAAFLQRSGESTVMLYGHKCFDYICCIAGCLLAGVTYIAVTAGTPEKRIGLMLEQSGTRLILDLCREHRWESLPEGITPLTMEQVLCAPNDNWELPQIPLSRPAYILFTSGSTGTPKGVMVTYANLENFLRWFGSIPAIAETLPKTVLNQADFSFDLSVADLYYTFWRGGCIVLTTAQPQDRMRELLSSNAQLAVMTPTHAELYLLDDRFTGNNMPQLSCFFFCGEVLRPGTAGRLLERFPIARILNAYGPTEATCAVSAAEITTETVHCKALPIGKNCGNAVDITLVDENGCQVPQGALGRILLTGASVAAGYLGNESGFSETGGKRSFLTGDLGSMQDGALWYGGRIDDQLKYKGYRLEPGEIECALCAIAGIMQAVVLPRRHPDGRVIALTAHLVCDRAMTEDSICNELRLRLPDYMIPRSICFHTSLPVTENGKTDRKKVAEW